MDPSSSFRPRASTTARRTKKRTSRVHHTFPTESRPPEQQSQGTALNAQLEDFEENGWKQAFQNTVFSQYCPPSRQFRFPTSIVCCDFDDGLNIAITTKNIDFNRVRKEPFQGNDCENEDSLRTALEAKVSPQHQGLKLTIIGWSGTFLEDNVRIQPAY